MEIEELHHIAEAAVPIVAVDGRDLTVLQAHKDGDTLVCEHHVVGDARNRLPRLSVASRGNDWDIACDGIDCVEADALDVGVIACRRSYQHDRTVERDLRATA